MSKATAVQEPKDVKKPRTSSILVKVTDEEKQRFEKLADAPRTNLQQSVRQTLHREADPSRAGA